MEKGYRIMLIETGRQIRLSRVVVVVNLKRRESRQNLGLRRWLLSYSGRRNDIFRILDHINII